MFINAGHFPPSDPPMHSIDFMLPLLKVIFHSPLGLTNPSGASLSTNR